MTKFAYNNAKNTSMDHTSFELNCNYHPQTPYKEDVNPCSQSKSADERAIKLKKLMTVWKQNFQHA